jgi:hypothetical protein
MPRLTFHLTMAIAMGLFVAGALWDRMETVKAKVATLIPEQPPEPRAIVAVYYDSDGGRLTFKKPESGPYTQPMILLDVPGGARVVVERDVLALQPHAWSATQCVILAHHGQAFGIRLAKSQGQPVMPPPDFPNAPALPVTRGGSGRIPAAVPGA